jgi:hypothetical protein
MVALLLAQADNDRTRIATGKLQRAFMAISFRL